MNKHITLFGLFIWLFFLTSSLKSIDVSAQNCPVANNLNTSNVSNFSVTLHWDFNTNVDYYRVRYKEVGTSSWSFEHNVISTSLDIDNLNFF